MYTYIHKIQWKDYYYIAMKSDHWIKRKIEQMNMTSMFTPYTLQ